jgi:hypothetical protein
MIQINPIYLIVFFSTLFFVSFIINIMQLIGSIKLKSRKLDGSEIKKNALDDAFKHRRSKEFEPHTARAIINRNNKN